MQINCQFLLIIPPRSNKYIYIYISFRTNDNNLYTIYHTGLLPVIQFNLGQFTTATAFVPVTDGGGGVSTGN